MGTYAVGENELDASGMRVALAVSRFNDKITRELLDGACRALAERGLGADDLTVAWVPGAFELPLVAKRLADSGRFDAVVCLGAVVRGDTPHFEYVAGGAASGIMEASLETGVPIVFGVLTTDTVEQAEARAGGAVGNKGVESARTAIEMVELLRRLPTADGER